MFCLKLNEVIFPSLIELSLILVPLAENSFLYLPMSIRIVSSLLVSDRPDSEIESKSKITIYITRGFLCIGKRLSEIALCHVNKKKTCTHSYAVKNSKRTAGRRLYSLHQGFHLVWKSKIRDPLYNQRKA